MREPAPCRHTGLCRTMRPLELQHERSVMVVSGGMGWRIPAIADAVLEDKIRHAHPIGTIELTCPTCTVPRQMDCYRFADGPFGTHKALHFVCTICGGTWTADKS